MTNELIFLRMLYQDATDNIRLLKKLEAAHVTLPATRESAEDSVLYWKTALLTEMERVSWLLWPETGRPYKGYWAVYVRPGEPAEYVGACYVNSQARCIKFIENSTRSMQYYIAKFGENNG